MPGNLGGYPGASKNMINIFGINIEVPPVKEKSVLEDILVDVAKKESERKILKDFLLAKSPSGHTRLAETTDASKVEVNQITEIDKYKPQATSYFLSRLKQSGAYEKMVLEVIAANFNSNSSKVARQLLDNQNPPLTSSFPSDHKKAEVLVYGSIASSIGLKECGEYLTYMTIKSRVREISKDMFYAINQGLDSDQIAKFTSVLYELRKLKTTDPTNFVKIKENICQSILLNMPIELTHMKCLRFTFPFGNRLKLIEHTMDSVVPTKTPGVTHRPKDESQLFKRLEKITDIFNFHDIPHRLIILMSDQDIYDYFPGGDGRTLVPNEDIQESFVSLQKYMVSIKQEVPTAEVFFLRDYLAQNNILQSFDDIHTKTISELKSGKSIVPEPFVESRVNYRYSSNERIYTINPGRQFARIQVNNIIASMQAISVLGQGIILVEDDRGEENNYIGGHGRTALPIFFCKLRDRFD